MLCDCTVVLEVLYVAVDVLIVIALAIAIVRTYR